MAMGPLTLILLSLSLSTANALPIGTSPPPKK